jgi:predicted DCC family thiol-disulfide oxidoreductase YuxK
MVQFVLHHDQRAIFRFASLQSVFATRILARHQIDPIDLDTFYIVLNYDAAEQPRGNETVLARSDAVLFLLENLDGFWRATAGIFRWLPPVLRDFAYRMIARHRYRIFGRYDTCPVPSEQTRSRFLDL